MAYAKDIVERYLADFYGSEDQAVKHYLADDLSFTGPAATFSTADAYLRASAHARHAARGVENRTVIAEGLDVAIFYDLLIDNPIGSVPIAEWYHVEDDKITSIRTILDTAPFIAPASKDHSQTALDPVCHMTVAKATAATRDYNGVTYYFCCSACAKAFENEPETYLTTSP